MYSSHELINNHSVAFHMLLNHIHYVKLTSSSNQYIDCHKNHRKYYEQDYIKISCRVGSSETAEVVNTRGQSPTCPSPAEKCKNC